LNASKNLLPDSAAVAELCLCASLNTLDVSHNALDGDAVLDAIAAAPALLSLALAGNPVMTTPHLRKTMIGRLPRLAYLDRPVFAAERLAAEAWGRGGLAAEAEARAQHREAQRLKARAETQAFREWKAAKIAERVRAGLPVLAPVQAPKESLSGGAGETPSGEDPLAEKTPASAAAQAREEASPPSDGVNVVRAAHKFWSAEATRLGNPGPAPNELGHLDVASFRAPSFVPEAVSYSDLETKGAPVAELLPPPPTALAAEKGGDFSSVAQALSLPPPPVLATDFNELD
jgi:hypothetical protein